MPVLSVVIPVFNEEKTIAQVIAAVAALPLDLEIVVVDDCSRDGTPQVLQELAPRSPALRVVRHERNQGKTAAVRTGISHTRGDVVIIQDADLEQDPREVPEVVRPILEGKAQAVFGSRFLRQTKTSEMSWGQWLGNRSVTLFSNLLTGYRLTDVETGYKAIRGDIFRSMKLTSSGFGMEVEIPARLAARGIDVTEVPVSYNARDYQAGKKIHVGDGLMALWYVFKYNVIARMEGSANPVHDRRAP
jgi:glycosyltransferase involved in cell wall biosynthesis